MGRTISAVYRSPMTQVLLIAIVCFCCPGKTSSFHSCYRWRRQSADRNVQCYQWAGRVWSARQHGSGQCKCCSLISNGGICALLGSSNFWCKWSQYRNHHLRLTTKIDARPQSMSADRSVELSHQWSSPGGDKTCLRWLDLPTILRITSMLQPHQQCGLCYSFWSNSWYRRIVPLGGTGSCWVVLIRWFILDIWYTRPSQIMVSYPLPDQKGRAIGMFWVSYILALYLSIQKADWLWWRWYLTLEEALDPSFRSLSIFTPPQALLLMEPVSLDMAICLGLSALNLCHLRCRFHGDHGWGESKLDLFMSDSQFWR